jgi:SAM-dependent methyltransferase
MTSEASLTRPTLDELMQIYRVKYYRFGEPGWGPKLRLAAGYFTPDDHYEALVAKLVVPGSTWADVGCGRDIFPSHPDLARELSARAGYVLGIDPDDNVHENPFVTEKFQGLIQDYHADQRFDVITLRMVAEHIVDPASAMRKLAEMLKPGGAVVIYTPYKWAPMSVVASVVPFRLHNPLKRLIWGSESRDTFPTAYRMNTRRDLLRHATAAGLMEASFELLDDCRVTQNFKLLNRIELGTRGLLNRIGLRYPELCILAVYTSPIAGGPARQGRAATDP